MALKRIAKEHAYLQHDPLLTCFAGLAPTDNPLYWIGHITGPPDTPYAQQSLPIAITFPEEYPRRPFKLTFTAPVSHPSVSEQGDVQLPELEERHWSPVLTVSSILVCLQALLSDPGPSKSAVGSEGEKVCLNSKHPEQDGGADTAAAHVEPTHCGRKIGDKIYRMDMRTPEFAVHEGLPEAEKDAFFILHGDVVRDA